MSTLFNRPNTALLVVDMQNGVVATAYARGEIIANVAVLVEKARRDRIPVIWIQHADHELARGSDAWQIVPELTPDAAERLVEKSYRDAFESTNLEQVLAHLGIGQAVPQRPSLADTATISQAAQAALAAATEATSPAPSDGAASGPGSVTGTSGTTYDFTNMTNAQAYAAANQLYSAGKITVGELAQIQIMAQGGDTIRIPIAGQGGDPTDSGNSYFADNLKSPTPHNFLTEVSNQLASDLRSPDDFQFRPIVPTTRNGIHR
jgi:hypothetical protein